MSAARRQDGFTLTEVLVAMLISIIVLGAVLGIFETFIKQTRRVELRASAQDTSRTIIDDVARTLRNQVGQSGASNTQVERAQSYDLIVRGFDPAAVAANTSGLRRVRYCVDATTPSDGKLVRQIQTWSTAAIPAMPAATSCPGTGWTTTATLASGVTNQRDGLNRPLWSYNSVTDGAVTTTTGVDASLWMRIDPSSATSEVNLSTGVTLRNANRPPTAAFTYTKTARGTMILNAAPSLDPEGQPLTYAWTVGGNNAGAASRFETSLTAPTSVTLTVTDTGGLTATQTQPVSYP